MILEEYKKYLKLNGIHEKRWTTGRTFVEFCTSNNIDYLNLSYSQLQDYGLFLKNKKQMNNTYNINLFGMRLFFKFLIDSGRITEDKYELIKKLKPYKIEHKVKDYITKDELIEIIHMAETFISYIDIDKLRAILYFMFYTGLRRGEFCKLKRSDIDLVNRTVIVKTPTKNKWERVVPFPAKIAATKHQKSIDFVQLLKTYFVSEGENENAFNMNAPTLTYMFDQLKPFAPNKKLCPHLMRHSFARMLAKAGVDSRVAQKLLGHKDITTTMLYYDPDIDTIQDLYNEKVK